MNGRVKWMLGGLGFLGANGIVLPTLNSNYGLFEGFNNLDWGGHQIWQGNDQTTSRKESKLEIRSEALKSQSYNFGLSEGQTNLPQVKLEVDKSLTPLPLSGLIEESGSVQNIVKNVIDEIKTESQVSDLQTQTQAKYESAVKQHLNGKPGLKEVNLKNFQAVKKQVEDWTSKGQLKRGIAPISQKNRESLQKMYALYSNLADDKDKLLENLNEIKKLEGAYFSRLVDRPLLKDIQSSLRTIRWGQSKVKLTRQEGANRAMYRNDWGGWDRNPYKHFYKDEKSYQRDITALNGSVAALTSAKQRISRERSMYGSWGRAAASFDQEEQQLKKMASNVGSHIELQVAKKLLENMNLLPKRK